MSSEPLIIERTFNAPIQLVWKALSDNNEMKKWYFQLPEFKPEVGFKFQFTGGKDGKTCVHLCVVTEVVTGKKLSYSWKYEGHGGMSYVTFELFEQGKKTKLKLTHAGLDTFPLQHPDFAERNFEASWNYLLGICLKDFVEAPSVSDEAAETK